MNDFEGHCLTRDSDLFAQMDDMAEFAIAHAAELAARDRLTAAKAESQPLALSSVHSAASVLHSTEGAL